MRQVHVLTRAAVAVLSLAGVITALSATPASASSKAPIIIGYITDETGAASSTYINAIQGAQARIDAQNAVGGVNGHKLELVAEDDQSTPTGNSTAAHLLVSKGAFGIIEDNSGAFGSSPLPPPTRDTRGRCLRRRPRMGRATEYQHVLHRRPLLHDADQRVLLHLQQQRGRTEGPPRHQVGPGRLQYLLRHQRGKYDLCAGKVLRRQQVSRRPASEQRQLESDRAPDQEAWAATVSKCSACSQPASRSPRTSSRPT